MKKNYQPFLGAVLVTLGLLLGTGVDQNPVQALPALLLTGAGTLVFNRAERIGKREKTGTMPKVYDIKRSIDEDAA